MIDAKLPPPETSDHPVDIGLRSEAAILSELIRRGYSVLVPFGFNQRYDLALDLGGRFRSVQCKTGRYRNGSVQFSTRSVRTNGTGVHTRRYDGEAELFLVYCPANHKIYAVPVEGVPRSEMALRVEPSQNGQGRGVNLAEDYELPA